VTVFDIIVEWSGPIHDCCDFGPAIETGEHADRFARARNPIPGDKIGVLDVDKQCGTR
jgi:hypothetical protein